MSWFWFYAFMLLLGWNAFLMATNADLRRTIRRQNKRLHDQGLDLLAAHVRRVR